MNLLDEKTRDKLAFLLRQLREAAQELLEPFTHRSAHTVAACVEVLEEMFHVEQTPPPDPTSGSGSPFFSQPVRSVPRETYPGSRSDSDDHVYEPVAYLPSRLAPPKASLDRPSGPRPEFKTILAGIKASQRPKPIRRGRWKVRRRRR